MYSSSKLYLVTGMSLLALFQGKTNVLDLYGRGNFATWSKEFTEGRLPPSRRQVEKAML
jgi:hypothetical protein